MTLHAEPHVLIAGIGDPYAALNTLNRQALLLRNGLAPAKIVEWGAFTLPASGSQMAVSFQPDGVSDFLRPAQITYTE